MVVVRSGGWAAYGSTNGRIMEELTYPLQPVVVAFLRSLADEFRQELKKPDISGSDLVNAAKLVAVLERLPLVTPGVALRATRSMTSEYGAFSVEMRVDEEALVLDSTESFYGEYGTDHETRVFLRAEVGGRCYNDLYNVRDAIAMWSEHWRKHAECGTGFGDEANEINWSTDENDGVG